MLVCFWVSFSVPLFYSSLIIIVLHQASKSDTLSPWLYSFPSTLSWLLWVFWLFNKTLESGCQCLQKLPEIFIGIVFILYHVGKNWPFGNMLPYPWTWTISPCISLFLDFIHGRFIVCPHIDLVHICCIPILICMCLMDNCSDHFCICLLATQISFLWNIWEKGFAYFILLIHLSFFLLSCGSFLYSLFIFPTYRKCFSLSTF